MESSSECMSSNESLAVSEDNEIPKPDVVTDVVQPEKPRTVKENRRTSDIESTSFSLSDSATVVNTE